MSYYKYEQILNKIDSAAFDQLHSPGSKVPHSGIYRCAGCAREDANNQGDPFPPQNHHQHSAAQGTIRWQLVVATQQ